MAGKMIDTSLLESIGSCRHVITTTIIIFSTGEGWPRYCEQMPRSPMPMIGQSVSNDFPQVLASALQENNAIHDGAILASRLDRQASYRVAAWSLRLFPPPVETNGYDNQGSAFNSCLAMSATSMVDSAVIISTERIIEFRSGRVFWIK